MSDTTSKVEELLPKIAAMLHARGESPYVFDLIEVLLPAGAEGVQRTSVLRAVEESRRRKGLPVPDRFEEAVQGEFDLHCATSAVFKKRGVAKDALFTSRVAGSTAVWSVDPERAYVWLALPVIGPVLWRGY